MDSFDPVTEGYLNLLEEIANNRTRQFRQAYWAWLNHPYNVNYEAKLFRAEQKMKSAPTNYSDGEIIAIERMVHNEWLSEWPRRDENRAVA